MKLKIVNLWIGTMTANFYPTMLPIPENNRVSRLLKILLLICLATLHYEDRLGFVKKP
jgi:hypothetical protein